jgi:hypothetical protein
LLALRERDSVKKFFSQRLARREELIALSTIDANALEKSGNSRVAVVKHDGQLPLRSSRFSCAALFSASI